LFLLFLVIVTVFILVFTPDVSMNQYFLLDKNQIVKDIGAIDDKVDSADEVKKYFENAVVALESGKTPSPKTTKAIGCFIKTKK
jgi:hypothetical protein